MKPENEEKQSKSAENRPETRRARKPYHTPHLTVYGSLKDLTMNVGNGAVDFPMGSHIAG
jgi:hypothetical protein